LNDEKVRELLLNIAARPSRIANKPVVDALAGGMPSLLPEEPVKDQAKDSGKQKKGQDTKERDTGEAPEQFA